MEIEKAELKPDEDEELEKEHRILVNHERLYTLIESVYKNVSESRGGCLTGLRKIKNDMDEIIQIDTKLSALDNQFKDAFYEIEDFSDSIRNYKLSVAYDPDRLTIVEGRMTQIRNLKQKYADSIPELQEYLIKSRLELNSLENWEDEKKNLEKEIDLLEKNLSNCANELSEKRKKAAVILQERIENELSGLGMQKVRFRVLVRPKNKDKLEIGMYGMDTIEFVISANPGEPYKRLRKIASGGELSRVMLAIKSILAESDNINTLIFDEVDAGIGGNVALSVGDRLKKLSELKQILCITHLATIAVRSDNHLKVQKLEKDNRTVTYIERIKGDNKKIEISRMLSGDIKGEAALKHAEELIKKYEKLKN